MKSKNLLQKIFHCSVLLLVLSALVTPGRAGASATGALMYEYPTVGTLWNDMLASNSSTVPFVIANPGSGPGVSADPTYTTSINNAVASGKRVLGYVYTSYQTRNYQDVYDDIDAWYQLYPQISGIFIDLIEDNTAAQLCYAASLYNHVKNTHPNDLVILNPGTNISPDYEPYGDIFLNAENTFAAYQSSWAVLYPGWEDNPAYRNRFWHSIHTTSLANYPTALSLTQARNAGWVYLTDAVMPNPYNVTPSYWSTELTDLAGLPAVTIPNRGKTQLPTGCQDLTASTANTAAAGTKQVRTTSAITVTNSSSTYNVEPTTGITFSLPAGVTLSGSGTNWTCDADSCDYSAAIPASGNAAVLAAAFTAACDYTGGNVSAVLRNFAGNAANFTITPTRPGDCAAGSAGGGTLADTGLPMGVTTAAAAVLGAATFGVRFSRTRLHYVHRSRR